MMGEECGHVGRRDGVRGEGASKWEEGEEGCLCCDQPIMYLLPVGLCPLQ